MNANPVILTGVLLQHLALYDGCVRGDSMPRSLKAEFSGGRVSAYCDEQLVANRNRSDCDIDHRDILTDDSKPSAIDNQLRAPNKTGPR